jgi:L-arabinose transport system substrate-binding protein
MLRRGALALVALRLLGAAPLGAAPLGATVEAAFPAIASPVPARIKIGFIVKQPEEPWFQNEWKFAELAGKDHGFDVIKIGATDGEKVLAGIDTIAAQGARGLVICTPDVMLSPAIVAEAAERGLKVFSVDDRFVGADGSPIEGVPYMGISARLIGEAVGEALVGQMNVRKWRMEDTGAISISIDTLATGRERKEGTISALLAAGFPRANIFAVPQQPPTDVESGFNAAQIVLTKHPTIRKWLIFGLNDETVLGGVRATENRGLTAEDVVAVGIGGQKTAIIEFRKRKPTAFYATVTISSKRHGYETAELLWKWIATGEAPPMQTLTAGMLMTRENMASVLVAMGLEE